MEGHVLVRDGKASRWVAAAEVTAFPERYEVIQAPAQKPSPKAPAKAEDE